MSASVVWIDERGDLEGRRQRLHQAHTKARQKRIQAAHGQYRREDKQRGHPVYKRGPRHRIGPRDRNLIDAATLIGWLAVVAIVMGLVQ